MVTSARFLLALLATCGFLAIASACQDASMSFTAPAESEAQLVSGVSGTVVAESDVRGQPDSPLARQTVVLIPLEALQSVAGSALPLTDDRLRFLSASIQEGHSALVTGLTDAQGQYALAAPPGAYGLCLADSEGADPVGLPLVTRGCGRVVVEPGKVTTANVSSGYGEILVVSTP